MRIDSRMTFGIIFLLGMLALCGLAGFGVYALFYLC